MIAYGWRILPDDSWYKFPLGFLLLFCRNVRVIITIATMCAKCPIIILPDPFSPFHFGNLIRMGYIKNPHPKYMSSKWNKQNLTNDPRAWLKISANGIKPHILVLSHRLPQLKMETEEGKDWVWFFTWV